MGWCPLLALAPIGSGIDPLQLCTGQVNMENGWMDAVHINPFIQKSINRDNDIWVLNCTFFRQFEIKLNNMLAVNYIFYDRYILK